MEDHTGLLDVVLFSSTLERLGDTLVKNRAYVVEGTLQNNAERGVAVIAESVKPLVIRAEGREPVRLRGSVLTGPLGVARAGPGRRGGVRGGGLRRLRDGRGAGAPSTRADPPRLLSA